MSTIIGAWLVYHFTLASNASQIGTAIPYQSIAACEAHIAGARIDLAHAASIAREAGSYIRVLIPPTCTQVMPRNWIKYGE